MSRRRSSPLDADYDERAIEENEIAGPDEVERITHGSYLVTRLDTVTAERVSWLWPGRLPVGKLVVLDGDPGIAKSTMAVDVAARLTTGRSMPGEELACLLPCDVIMLAAEDGLADTIRPRLDAAGADPARVHHLDKVVRENDDGAVTFVPPSIPEHVATLERLIVDTGAKFVVVDVLMAYLSGRHDSHRDQDVRGALAQLAEVADRTGACILLLRHLRKSRGSAMYAGGGTIGIIGVARVGLVAAQHPDDEALRVLAVTKSNLAAMPPALGYRLVEHGNGMARLEWAGPVDTTADALMAQPDNEDRSALDDASEWLRSMLEDGPTLKREIVSAARREGFSTRTIERASTRLSVAVDRDENTRGRPARWALPDYSPTITRQTRSARNLQPSHLHLLPETVDYSPTSDLGEKPPNGHRPTCEVCGTETLPHVTIHPLCDPARR